MTSRGSRSQPWRPESQSPSAVTAGLPSAYRAYEVAAQERYQQLARSNALLASLAPASAVSAREEAPRGAAVRRRLRDWQWLRAATRRTSPLPAAPSGHTSFSS
ncbi:MAG TPA: hypothetical protein VFQ80_12745 [Thermomicrobiales bacterium]|nr:hypothetical protein [Thermomicrobiales bacterium]